MSTLIEAVEKEVQDRVAVQVAAAVEAATANFRQVGTARARVLTFPEGVEEISLSALLAHNNVTMDLDNMTVVSASDAGNKTLTRDSSVSAGSNIIAGAVEPNGSL